MDHEYFEATTARTRKILDDFFIAKTNAHKARAKYIKSVGAGDQYYEGWTNLLGLTFKGDPPPGWRVSPPLRKHGTYYIPHKRTSEEKKVYAAFCAPELRVPSPMALTTALGFEAMVGMRLCRVGIEICSGRYLISAYAGQAPKTLAGLRKLKASQYHLIIEKAKAKS